MSRRSRYKWTFEDANLYLGKIGRQIRFCDQEEFKTAKINTWAVCIKPDCGYKWKVKRDVIINGRSGCPMCYGNLPWTNELFDKFLLENNSSIKRIGDCNGCANRIEINCQKCNKTWFPYLNDIVNAKSGCTRCSNREAWTNVRADEFLVKNNFKIKRISGIFGKDIPFEYKCLICGFIGSTRIGSLRHSVKNKKSTDGCKRCSNRLKLTNEIIDERMLNRTVTRISDIRGAMVPCLWKCTFCSFEWNAKPHNVSCAAQSGCPQCNLYKK